MKKINLLGIRLKDRYVKEALMMTERFLREGAVHVILYLTTTSLLEAAKNEKGKEWIESANATLWGDIEILKAAEITNRGRYEEVLGKEFLQSFLRRMAKTHTSILVLSDTEEHAQNLKEELLEMQSGITVTGTIAIENAQVSREHLINEINLIAPSVIISRMSFPMQCRWLKHSRQYMNARLWLGMPEDFSCVAKKEMPVDKVNRRILNVLLSRRMHKYKK